MRKTINRLVILFAVLLITYGCETDDETQYLPSSISSLDITIKGQQQKIEEVHLIAYTKKQSWIVTKAKWNNNRFLLNLPDEVNPGYLSTLSTLEGLKTFEGCDISEPSAQICYATLNVIGPKEMQIGFVFQKNPQAVLTSFFFYVDRDVRITGKTLKGIPVDISFSKGWNLACFGENAVTTNIPANLEWVITYNYINPDIPPILGWW